MVLGQDATLNCYYHYIPLPMGSGLVATFESSFAPVALSPIMMKAMALGVNEQQMETLLLPVQANNHPIYDPSLNYSVYLSQPFLFVLFQVLVLLIMVYVVGGEIKFHAAGEWLQAAGSDITIAVIDKLLPHILVFSPINILGNPAMFGILYIPLQGSWLLLNGVTVLSIIATQILALFIFPLFPTVAIIIGIVSMVGPLGVTLSGATFPILNTYSLV